MSRNEPPDPIDVSVGAQIKSRRLAQGLNQTQLGAAIGVTFQQVQKYERGTNRVSASMLHRITKSLGCRVQDVFPGADDAATGPALDPIASQTIQAMGQLSKDNRRLVLALARALADKAS